MLRLDTIRDLDDKVRRAAMVLRMTAIGLLSCGGELASVGCSHACAVVLLAIGTGVAVVLVDGLAVLAGVGLGADTDDISDLDTAFSL